MENSPVSAPSPVSLPPPPLAPAIMVPPVLGPLQLTTAEKHFPQSPMPAQETVPLLPPLPNIKVEQRDVVLPLVPPPQTSSPLTPSPSSSSSSMMMPSPLPLTTQPLPPTSQQLLSTASKPFSVLDNINNNSNSSSSSNNATNNNSNTNNKEPVIKSLPSSPNSGEHPASPMPPALRIKEEDRGSPFMPSKQGASPFMPIAGHHISAIPSGVPLMPMVHSPCVPEPLQGRGPMEQGVRPLMYSTPSPPAAMRPPPHLVDYPGPPPDKIKAEPVESMPTQSPPLSHSHSPKLPSSSSLHPPPLISSPFSTSSPHSSAAMPGVGFSAPVISNSSSSSSHVTTTVPSALTPVMSIGRPIASPPDIKPTLHNVRTLSPLVPPQPPVSMPSSQMQAISQHVSPHAASQHFPYSYPPYFPPHMYPHGALPIHPHHLAAYHHHAHAHHHHQVSATLTPPHQQQGRSPHQHTPGISRSSPLVAGPTPHHATSFSTPSSGNSGNTTTTTPSRTAPVTSTVIPHAPLPIMHASSSHGNNSSSSASAHHMHHHHGKEKIIRPDGTIQDAAPSHHPDDLTSLPPEEEQDHSNPVNNRGPSPEPKIEDNECHRSQSAM